MKIITIYGANIVRNAATVQFEIAAQMECDLFAEHIGIVDHIAIIITIIITRPKPAYGRQGLAGLWGRDTDEMSTFLVFLTSHFAPAALSSDLKIL